MTEKHSHRPPAERDKPAEKKSAPSGEGAPKLETPERKHEPPKEAPRDETPQLETPEEKSETLQERVVDATTELAEQSEERLEENAVVEFRVSGEVVSPEAFVDSLADSLLDHVSQSPVDAHAPVWGPRTPNTEGGYQ